jgi:NAD(P)-dependent dehydrogenase (short-subunit alcohol dehydrogenase family)
MSSQHTVIVGGSSGIGLATARHLLASGARVTITGRNETRLVEARRQLGPEAQAVPMDAAAADALPAQFAQIGKFDHLVLALGSGKGVGPFATVSLADVKLGFEEKVFAHFATAQAALPFLNPTGSLIFVSAVSAQAAVPGTAGIGAANAAVAALVPILAVELKPLRVNGVSPGVIDTPWWDAMPEEQKQAMFEDFAAKTPVGRVGRPEDVAQAIAFLISDDFMTGHMLVCDGGLRFTA